MLWQSVSPCCTREGSLKCQKQTVVTASDLMNFCFASKILLGWSQWWVTLDYSILEEYMCVYIYISNGLMLAVSLLSWGKKNVVWPCFTVGSQKLLTGLCSKPSTAIFHSFTLASSNRTTNFTLEGWSRWSNDIGVPYEFSRPSPQTIDTRQDIRKLRQELMCLYGVDSLRRAPWTCRWILVWCEMNYSDIQKKIYIYIDIYDYIYVTI